MTDHDDNIDDLASAYLDDELSANEHARVAVDDAVLARAAELSSARQVLRSAALPVDPAHREHAVAAALAAFGDEGVASIAVARSRRARRAAQLVGVAAAVALLALAVPFLGDLDSGSDDAVEAGRAESTDQSMNADASASPIAPEALSVAPSGSLEDLGTFGDVAELAAAVRTRLDRSSADAAPATGGSSGTPADDGQAAGGCSAERAAAAPVTFTAVAELDGRAVLVLVRDEGESRRTMLALDLATCAEVVSQTL